MVSVNPITLICPSPLPSAPVPLFYISMSLFLFYISIHLYYCLDSTYERCTLFVILCLTLLSIIPPRSIHVAANCRISFFFMAGFIVYVYIYIPHLYPFVCWWVLELLLYNWLLKIVLLWTLGCMYLFELVFSFFLDIYLGVVLLDHMVVLFLVF